MPTACPRNGRRQSLQGHGDFDPHDLPAAPEERSGPITPYRGYAPDRGRFCERQDDPPTQRRGARTEAVQSDGRRRRRQSHGRGGDAGMAIAPTGVRMRLVRPGAHGVGVEGVVRRLGMAGQHRQDTAAGPAVKTVANWRAFKSRDLPRFPKTVANWRAPVNRRGPICVAQRVEIGRAALHLDDE